MPNPHSEQAGESYHGPLEEALVHGAPRRVGSFRYYFDEDRWEWSQEVERMHGYEPGSVTPTTELVLSHKHPDDYRHIADTLQLIRQTRQAFSTRHRIVDVQGRVHHVAVVGDQLRNNGEIIGTQGFYIDVTPTEKARQERMTAAIARITEDRAVIEQAKGMLMVIYGVEAATASELLLWRAEETRVDLRLLAEQLVADFRTVSYQDTPPSRASYDNLLLTAHQRVTGEAVQNGRQ
jgi:PAS domain S-box-containing protein